MLLIPIFVGLNSTLDISTTLISIYLMDITHSTKLYGRPYVGDTSASLDARLSIYHFVDGKNIFEL